MSKETKLAAIREKVIVANPSILNLEFGCRFFFKGNNSGCVALSNGDWKRLHFIIKKPLLEPKYDTLNRNELLKDQLLEVVGRPIRFTDVLFAVKEKDRNLEKQFADDHLGHAPIKYNFFYQCMMLITKHDMDGGEFWNLTDDDLSHQSEDTINFLAEILK